MRTAIIWQIYRGVNTFLNVVSGILFVYCLMTWFVRPGSQLYSLMQRVIDPIVAPFRPLARRLMERGLMLDISVLLAIFGVQILRYLLSMLIGYLL